MGDNVRHGLDFDARYSVEGMPGVAWYLIGYVQRADEDTEWSGYYIEDTDWVIAVMVGDDRRHEIEADTLVLLADEDYCHECGQIGCTHDGLDRD